MKFIFLRNCPYLLRSKINFNVTINVITLAAGFSLVGESLRSVRKDRKRVFCNEMKAKEPKLFKHVVLRIQKFPPFIRN